MPRRQKSGLDLIAALPWPIGIAMGLLAYWGIRYGVGMYFSHTSSPVTQGMGTQLLGGALAPLAWVALVMCWIAAAVSFFKARQRKRILETRTGLDSLAALSWREFEMLVGEAYRRQGYSVEEHGLGGADGGIDLILRKGGGTWLVQCKQWRTQQVNVPRVREMWGLVDHHRADGVKIVSVGEFTRDAKAFAAGKAIELVNGMRLLDMVRSAQVASPGGSESPLTPATPRHGAADDQTPACPRCGTAMLRRTNGKTGQPFWGCRHFPKCHGTVAVP
jgi:restriction system protein